MKQTTLLLSFLLLIFCSCNQDVDDDYTTIQESELDLLLERSIDVASNGEGAGFFTLPESGDYNSIPQDPLNPITQDKVDLGRLLLHETGMGGKPKMNDRKFQYACATCHPVASAFASGRRQGVGEGGIGFGLKGEGRLADLEMPLDSLDVQPVRVPTLLNLAYQDVALWDGRFGGTGTNAGTEAGWDLIPENFEGFQGIEVQAMQGQDEHRLLIDEYFIDTFNYRVMFDAAFGDVPEEERYSRKTAALAIAAYNRTLLSNEAPWQAYLKGDLEAMSDREKRGAIVFMNEGKCVQCHTGPALKDRSFHAMGFADFDNAPDAIVKPDVDMSLVTRGRGSFTGNPQDDYKFKTPTLYNLVDTEFYGHGSSFSSVLDVVRYKNNGAPQNTNVPSSQLASQFGNLGLSENQMNDLTVFIERSLRDSNLVRYVPEEVNSGFCFPANDAQARIDIGCD
ncbi:cytochrome-c peroxidase [Dokdonia sinensis]|uniref:Cytochrome-c peroxidase n=1 Tax=Dokdonia sinensis TaxID=2479847 RepID=A0A3M0G0V8_9FLAO|nr:cytochrome c peroxidase [Dokdonia sinensis]RMB58600.1 cytochrome-c peroxidase [Dokdonia sinensis]